MILILTASLVAAFILEWTTGSVFSFWGIAWPLVISVVIFWFWRLKLLPRILLGVFIGIFMDGISPHPWGTYLVLFMILAILSELLQLFFSDTVSHLARGISMAISLFLTLNLIYPIAILIGQDGGWMVIAASGWLTTLLGAALFWSLIMPPLFFLAENFLAKAAPRLKWQNLGSQN